MSPSSLGHGEVRRESAQGGEHRDVLCQHLGDGLAAIDGSSASSRASSISVSMMSCRSWGSRQGFCAYKPPGGQAQWAREEREILAVGIFWGRAVALLVVDRGVEMGRKDEVRWLRPAPDVGSKSRRTEIPVVDRSLGIGGKQEGQRLDRTRRLIESPGGWESSWLIGASRSGERLRARGLSGRRDQLVVRGCGGLFCGSGPRSGWRG
jgi:hypothetical protein